MGICCTLTHVFPRTLKIWWPLGRTITVLSHPALQLENLLASCGMYLCSCYCRLVWSKCSSYNVLIYMLCKLAHLRMLRCTCYDQQLSCWNLVESTDVLVSVTGVGNGHLTHYSTHLSSVSPRCGLRSGQWKAGENSPRGQVYRPALQRESSGNTNLSNQRHSDLFQTLAGQK